MGGMRYFWPTKEQLRKQSGQHYDVFADDRYIRSVTQRQRKTRTTTGISRKKMKVGPHTEPPRQSDQLPVEIIEQIVSYALPSNNQQERQYTLWACCLIGKQWYSATINRLYERPLLVNKNFDKFAKTLCPPVNAHKRKIGLEHLIKCLDMGGLGYESTKSLTARLLRRTGPSLEVFVAPAVTFSIASHAPLAKSQNLRCLDLLHLSHHDMDIYQLLKITSSLSRLDKLSLPIGILGRKQHFPLTRWPPNMSVLQINGGIPADKWYWREMTRTWPTSLNTLILEETTECSYWTVPLTRNYTAEEIVLEHVTSLRLGMRRDPSSNSLFAPRFFSELLARIPSVMTLSIPAHLAESSLAFSVTSTPGAAKRVQRLDITAHPDYSSQPAKLSPEFLGPIAQGLLPNLLELRVDHETVGHRIDLVGTSMGYDDVITFLRRNATSIGFDPSDVFVCTKNLRSLSFNGC